MNKKLELLEVVIEELKRADILLINAEESIKDLKTLLIEDELQKREALTRIEEIIRIEKGKSLCTGTLPVKAYGSVVPDLDFIRSVLDNG